MFRLSSWAWPALLLTALLGLAGLSPARAGLPTIAYTGQLLSGGVPVPNGNYDFQFSLYTASVGGTKIGATISAPNVPVENGVYYVELNFGSVFNGSLMYLEADYRPAGGTTYLLPTPRHIVPTTAYAVYAATSSVSNTTKALQSKPISATAPMTGQVLTWTGTLWTPAFAASGTTGPAGGDLTGTYPNPTVGPNAIDHTKLASDAASLSQVSGGSLSTDGNGNAVAHGGRFTFDSPTSDSTAQFLRNGVFAWDLGVVNSGNSFYIGDGTDKAVTIQKGTRYVGIGTSTPQNTLDVNGGITGGNIVSHGTTFVLNGGGGGSGNNGGAGRALLDDGIYGLIINPYNDFGPVVIEGPTFIQGLASISGNVGIGTQNPQNTLDVNGGISAAAIGVSGGANVAGVLHVGGDFQLAGRGGGAGNNGGLARALVDGGPGGGEGLIINYSNDFGIVNVQSGMNVNGTMTANSLQITGGSDLAEPYKITASREVQPRPGLVVSIDPRHTGQMRVCARAYDTAVGGIISGAHGIQPGVVLRQTGTVADGTLPIACTGRVWCWCDADAGGAISPGNLLPTSATPGHAMRVGDYDKARGAILGKAMSALPRGKGMVLVLVTLE